MTRKARLLEAMQKTAKAVLLYWRQSPNGSTAPASVKEAMAILQSEVAEGNDTLLSAAEQLGAAAADPAGTGSWLTEALRATIAGLDSLARQLRHSAIAQEVLQLCEDVRNQAPSFEGNGESAEVRLQAALMVIEDATFAVEGYRALGPFAHVDEAYLAKYGLLQALQLGFDGAQAVCAVVGMPLRADQVSGGKAVKITRTIVAGHPLGGRYEGSPWEHFHDRHSAHDKSVMKIMSFDRRDPKNWTGQTHRTIQLMDHGLAVIRELLTRALRYMKENDANRPSPDSATS